QRHPSDRSLDDAQAWFRDDDPSLGRSLLPGARPERLREGAGNLESGPAHERVRSLKLRRALLGGGVLVALSSAPTLALASKRIVAEEAAFRAPAAGRCAPQTLNRSAVLAGTSLAVSPLPDSYDASPNSQISLLGAPPQALVGVRVSGSETGSHPGRLLGDSQGDGASFVATNSFRPGETVTGRGEVREGSAIKPFAFHFTVARQDPLTYTATAHQARDPNEMQHFHSSPQLLAPVIGVTVRSSQTAPGYLFAAPYAGP